MSSLSSSYCLGVFFILLVSIIWSISSVFVSILYNNAANDPSPGSDDNHHEQEQHSSLTPFIVTYIGVSLFTILLPLHMLMEYIQKLLSCHNDNRQQSNNIRYESIPASLNIIDDGIILINSDYHDDNDDHHRGVMNHMLHHDHDRLLLTETMIIPPFDKEKFHKQQRQPTHLPRDDDDNDNANETDDNNGNHRDHPLHIVTNNDELGNHDNVDTNGDLSTQNKQQPWELNDYLRVSIQIAPVWFLGNLCYNASLRYTSVTSSTVMASTSSLFTFLLAYFCHDEFFSIYKLLGVIFGITGSIITTLHDTNNNSNNDDSNSTYHYNESYYYDYRFNETMNNVSNIMITFYHDDATLSSQSQEYPYGILGDILSFLSAIGYAGYAIQTRLLCPHDESLYSMSVVLGYIGLWNMIFLSPIAVYQLYFIPHRKQLSWMTISLLCVKGILDNVLSDYLWLRAVMLTDATVATVGLGLTIPLAFISDVIRGYSENVLSIESLVGATMVLIGFLLVNIADYCCIPSSSASHAVSLLPAAAPTTVTMNPHVTNSMHHDSFDNSFCSNQSTSSSQYYASISMSEYDPNHQSHPPLQSSNIVATTNHNEEEGDDNDETVRMLSCSMDVTESEI